MKVVVTIATPDHTRLREVLGKSAGAPDGEWLARMVEHMNEGAWQAASGQVVSVEVRP